MDLIDVLADGFVHLDGAMADDGELQA